jgi:heptosyltransferase-2
VIAPSWIGDVVMATSFLSVLRKQNPDDFITVMCREYVADLLERSSFIDDLITYDRRAGVMRAAGRLRSRGTAWDATFILPMSVSSALIPFLAGTGRRIGYGGSGRSWLLSDSLRLKEPREVHLTGEYARIALHYSGKAEDDIPGPVVVPPYDWRKRVGALGLPEKYAAYSAGAKYGPAKMWPGERFAELARRLREEQGLHPVFIGSSEELAYIDTIKDKAGGLNLSGKSGIDDLMCVLRGASAVVGNDSGPVHVSAAMGVPTVSIFGSTSPKWTAPRGRYSSVVAATAGCSPCFRKECPEGDYHCLTEITVDAVFAAATELIKESAE